MAESKQFPPPGQAAACQSFRATAGAVILIDQLTKYGAAHISGWPLNQYPPAGGLEVIPGCFNLVYVTNKGAAWGIFSGYGFWLGCLAAAALAAIYFFRDHLEIRRRTMQVIFGLICGGIAGNLLDRLIYGHVIDFLDFHAGHWHWPTFNVADSAIFTGVALYIFWHLKNPSPPPEAQQPGDPP